MVFKTRYPLGHPFFGHLGPVIYTRSKPNRGFMQPVGLRDSLLRVDLIEYMSLHYQLSALLTLFTKINVQIKITAELKMAQNAVLLNSG